MERLRYIIEDNTIAEVLGVQNFTNQESAILELVKNAYDAKADKVSIEFYNDLIVVEDDGVGMNLHDIRRHWMHVGKSDKDYELVDKNGEVRIYAGSKGIGRFALSRLGSKVILLTRKEGNSLVSWKTDWNESVLEELDGNLFQGTRFEIRVLRDKWNKNSIKKLVDYLSRTYNSELMQIMVKVEGEKPVSIEKYFSKPVIGINCTSIINISYSAIDNELSCHVTSDEFQQEAKKYIEKNLYEFKSKVNCVKEFKGDKEINLTESELSDVLDLLGDFSVELYFSLKDSNSSDMDKFLYKNKKLPKRYKSGIILYRNAFSISSYDGTKDWLRLGKRSRLSPAAASHPTGNWRVRENQLAGKVEIDKKDNSMLKDLSNRQGLDENVYYEVFIKIISKGISEFERNRQNIIRKINEKNKIVEKESEITDQIIKNPKALKDLNNKDLAIFIREIKEFKNDNKNFKKVIINTEERYKYDVRILNVLATSGLKATSIAHEMHNDRNSIAQNSDNIIEAMKEFGLWEIVNESEKTKYAYSNIPKLIQENKKINTKLVSFMSTLLEEVEKSNFQPNIHDVNMLLVMIKELWERDYSWIKININIYEDTLFVLPEDSIKVIFDNLILNSIQHNDDRNQLNIGISVLESDGKLEISYSDNGKGLDEKYDSNPMKILEVHETSRPQGHGLGMWIVNNTIVMSGGEVIRIASLNGFQIDFSFGGNLSE